jgi:predicted nuclease with TOPRIM domain
LNLRPPGYEPGELPDCSTPRRGPDCSTLVTLVSMWDRAIWAALIVGALAGTGAFALLAVRSLRAWRAFKETSRRVVGRLDEFAAQAQAVADKLATTAVDTAELQQSLERLRVSLARLAVLRAAIDEADALVGRVITVVPRK